MNRPFLLPKFIGHRGAKGHAPENTLASFKLAHNLGAQWVETDVKETSDGVLILMHDDDLERTSNGHGKIRETSWQQLQAFDAGNWFSDKFLGEKIPSLAQAVELFKTLNLSVNLEIKPCPTKSESTAIKVAEFIKNQWPAQLPPPLVSSFDFEALRVAKQNNPELIIGLLFEGVLPANWKEQAQSLQAVSINIDDEIANDEIIREITQAGFLVLVYTVNSKQRANELYDFGVTSVFTDFP